MNKNLLKQLYWIIPIIFIVLGFALLFNHNFKKVSEPPAPNWSRALTVGETSVSRLPPITKTEEGNYRFMSFSEGKLATTTINSDFIVEDKQTYDIPVDKWTQIYQHNNHLIYFDYTNIYDKDQNIIIPDVERFYPLKTTIFYIKDKTLYELSPENRESKKIMNIDLNKQSIKPQENKDGIHILMYKLEDADLSLKLYQLQKGEINEVFQTQVKVALGKIVTEVQYVLEGQKLGIMLKQILKASAGKPQSYNYFMQTTIEGDGANTFHELTFKDPAGNGHLTEVSNVKMKFNRNKLNVLFQANGQTQTQYNDSTAINIYKAEINEDMTTTTERRSNTAALSVDPQWVNDETVAWLDLDSEANKINISSSNIAAVSQVTGFNSDDWMRALGKTLGMVSSSLFAVAISAVWFIWPVIFISLIYFFRNRTIDRDPIWFFYTGVGIYIIALLVWKNRFFVSNIYRNAPDYLTFNGSSYFYMFIFAAIAFGLVQLTKRFNDWDGTARIMYFVGVHILLLSTFFGPYLI